MEQNSAQPSLEAWERKTIENMVYASIREQRRNRLWRNLFRFVFIIIMLFIIFWAFSDTTKSIQPHTAVINIKGEIADEAKTSSKNIFKSLKKAFEDTYTRGIILDINSPGGSPVQSSAIFEEIIRLKEENPKIKVYAVCEDACASGAYYIAAAADEIYANKSSIVGSIGVVMSGFGFVDTIAKLGVERRLMTSGSEKGFLDPFSPTKPIEMQQMQTMLGIIHNQFIDSVKQGRGKRLKNNPDLFTGLFWTGQQALDLGLIDGFGTPQSVARNIIGEELLVDYSVSGSVLEQFSEVTISSAVNQIASYLGIRPAQSYVK